MPGALRRPWMPIGAKLRSRRSEPADPKAQLEQAIAAATDQHRELAQQADAVFAEHESVETRLERATIERDKLHARTSRATAMADDAAQRGDDTKVAEFTAAAESFASQLAAIETELDGVQHEALQSARASDEAKAALEERTSSLQGALAAHHQVLSESDQAETRALVDDALAALSEPAGVGIPTVEELRDRIAARSATAEGTP
jgi:phage shock protein A